MWLDNYGPYPPINNPCSDKRISYEERRKIRLSFRRNRALRYALSRPDDTKFDAFNRRATLGDLK